MDSSAWQHLWAQQAGQEGGAAQLGALQGVLQAAGLPLLAPGAPPGLPALPGLPPLLQQLLLPLLEASGSAEFEAGSNLISPRQSGAVLGPPLGGSGERGSSALPALAAPGYQARQPAAAPARPQPKKSTGAELQALLQYLQHQPQPQLQQQHAGAEGAEGLAAPQVRAGCLAPTFGVEIRRGLM